MRSNLVKLKKEIQAIEKACSIGDQAFQFILDKIKLEITEKQLAFELDSFVKQKNAGLSFPTIIAFDSNSSSPHHVASNKKLEKNEIILLDFGVKFDNYCSDMTRTIFFGKADEKQKRMYQTVLDAQQKAIEYLINKATKQSVIPIRASNVDRVARKLIISQGYPSIPHSLGHGIGLEVHEAPILSPNSKDELKNGMVFSIEPGIYIPGFGGVRIEDIFLLEKDKLRPLTHAPKNFIEL